MATLINFDEDVLPHIGAMGRYQLTLFLLMCIPATLPAAFLAFNQVFLSAEPDHWCRVPFLMDDADLGMEEAKAIAIPRIYFDHSDHFVYKRCVHYDVNFTQIFIENGRKWPKKPDEAWNETRCRNGWVYDKSEYENTLVTELDLVCDKKWWPSTSTALFYVGSLFGNILFGLIADKYGRRTSFFCLLFMEVGLSIVTSFAPDYVVFTVLRTINGFTFPALFQIPFILTLETMGPAYRTFAGMMICLFFAVALMILAGLAYIFNSWFELSLITSVPFVALFSYWWFVPESPRWLLSYGRLEEAEAVVQKMAATNGHHIQRDFLKAIIEDRRSLLPSGSPSSSTTSPSIRVTRAPSMMVLLWYYPQARRNFCLITFNWLVNAIVYNGLSFYSANLNVNSFLGFFISSAVEIPSYFIGWWLMDSWGRRWVLFSTMITGGVAGICCVFVPPWASPWYTVALAMVGKFQIAASFAVIYVYAGELMPTVVRSEAMGISSFVAGIGLLLFPYINELGKYNTILPLVIMGTLSVMGGMTSLFLPETLWCALPNTLEEGNAFGTNAHLCSCPSKTQAKSDGEEAEVNPNQRRAAVIMLNNGRVVLSEQSS